MRIGIVAVALACSLALAGCSDFFDGSDNDKKEAAIPPPDTSVPRVLDLVWAVKDDATPAQMAAFAQRIQQSSAALWASTQGQMVLRNVTLVDRSSDGDVILDNLTQRAAELAFAYTIQFSDGSWEVHLGGAYPMQAFLHEMGHAEVLQDWALAEEYDLPGAPCATCCMDVYVYGTGEGKVVYCDAANCNTSRNGCWPTVILPTHTNWTYPRTAGTAPAVTVTVQDN